MRLYVCLHNDGVWYGAGSGSYCMLAQTVVRYGDVAGIESRWRKIRDMRYGIWKTGAKEMGAKDWGVGWYVPSLEMGKDAFSWAIGRFNDERSRY